MLARLAATALLCAGAIANDHSGDGMADGTAGVFEREWEGQHERAKRFEQSMWTGPSVWAGNNTLASLTGKADWYIYDDWRIEEPIAEDDFSRVLMFKELQFFVSLRKTYCLGKR